jgi:aspartate-semialdehyde dehydrogenase
VHAPVFHGYSISAWIEFESRPAKEKLASALAAAHIEVRNKDEEAPSNVGVAGQSGITVGGIVPDRNNPRACWFWIVADNLRIAAENAVEVARELLA